MRNLLYRALNVIDSRCFVFLAEQPKGWKDRLERCVRQACDALRIQRRGVHGFRAMAACEFVNLKRALEPHH